MRNLAIVLALIFALSGGGYYYFYHYPPKVLERNVKRQLRAFDEAVATEKHENVSGFLQRILSPEANIELSIDFFSITQLGGNPIAQHFDKIGFINFVDNTLYSVTSPMHISSLEEFDYAVKGKGAHIRFTSTGNAEGNSYLQGAKLSMHYNAQSNCEADIDAEKMPIITHMTCEVHVRSLPKPEEAAKLRNPEAMRELLGGR